MPLKSVVWSLVCTHANALHFVCIYYFLGSMRCARRSPNVLPAYIAPVETTAAVFILNLTEMLISHTCLPEVNLRHVMMMSSSVFQTSNLRHLGSDISFCASFSVLRWGYFKILGKKNRILVTLREAKVLTCHSLVSLQNISFRWIFFSTSQNWRSHHNNWFQLVMSHWKFTRWLRL